MITESMKLSKHEKSFVADEEGNPVVIEHVQYNHVIERDGVVVSSIPHRIVLDRVNTPNYPMPDGTVKTTAEVITDIS